MTAPGSGVLNFVSTTPGVPLNLQQAVNSVPDLSSTAVVIITANVTSGELRKVTGVNYDKQFFNIESPFSVALVGVPLLVVKKDQFTKVHLVNTGGADGLVDGNIVVSGQNVPLNRDVSNRKGDEFVDPVIVDGTGTEFKILEIK